MKSLEIRILLLIGICICLAGIVDTWSRKYNLQWDLTEEKRYTLSSSTIRQLETLEEPLYIEVYLTGDLPAGFRRLAENLRAILSKMKRLSHGKLIVQYIDPSQFSSQRNYFLSLAEKGIQPTNLSYKEHEKTIEKLIFPGVLCSYQGRELGVMLLKGSRSRGSEGILNESIENLEYYLSSSIAQLQRSVPRQVGLFHYSEEVRPDEEQTQSAQLIQNLSQYNYLVKEVALSKKDLETIEVLLIVKPQKILTEEEKYALDQFLVQGGKVMCFTEGAELNMDSVSEEGTWAKIRETGLEDLLFHYGVRVQRALLEDLRSASYPVIAGQIGNQPQIRLVSWPFFLLAKPNASHPISKNIEFVMLRYASSIDTVKATGIHKTPLLFSSTSTRTLQAPLQVGLNTVRRGIDKTLYRSGPHVMAYLLEGRFRSSYTHKIKPLSAQTSTFTSQDTPGKLLVVGDSECTLSEKHPRTEEWLDIGMYWPERMQYGNLDFLLQALEYFFEEEGVILSRNRRIKYRPLNKSRITASKSWWQGINLLFPLGCVALIGLVRMLWRRKCYAS